MRRLGVGMLVLAVAIAGGCSDDDNWPEPNAMESTTTTSEAGCDAPKPSGFTIEVLGPPRSQWPNVVVTPGRLLAHVDRASTPTPLQTALSDAEYDELLSEACNQREVKSDGQSVGYNAWVRLKTEDGKTLRTKDISGQPGLARTPLGRAVNRIMETRCGAVALPDTSPSQDALRRCG